MIFLTNFYGFFTRIHCKNLDLFIADVKVSTSFKNMRINPDPTVCFFVAHINQIF